MLSENYQETMNKLEELEKEIAVARNCQQCASWKQKTEVLTTKFYHTIKNMRSEVNQLRRDSE